MESHVLSSDSPSSQQHVAVARYYNYTLPFYRWFWHGRTWGLHYGLAEPWTRDAGDEILNTNRFLARVAKIDRTCSVLDAGCGIGGSAVWIASHLGADVTGITLSERQLLRANELAARHGVARQVRFELRDYERSGYPEESFDVVWAIESACYAVDKPRLVRELYRLLRPRGRLVVADGFLRRQPLAGETEDFRTFLRGLVLPNLAEGGAFEAALREAGFCEVRRWDKTLSATPSSLRMHRRCSAGYPLSRLGELAGVIPSLLTRNIRAGVVQLGLVRSGLIAYEVFCAVKPVQRSGFVAEQTL